MSTLVDVIPFAEAFGGAVRRYDRHHGKATYTWFEGNGGAVDVLEFIAERCTVKAITAVSALALARLMKNTPPSIYISAEQKRHRIELAEQVVKAVGRRSGLDPARVARYLRGRVYSGVRVVASDGAKFNSATEAAKAKNVTKTAIITAIRTRKRCCGLTWVYADGEAPKPDYGSSFRTSFGNYLQQLRARRGMSITDLAKVVGVSNQACGEWEKGRVSPKPANVQRLAKHFGNVGMELLAIFEEGIAHISDEREQSRQSIINRDKTPVLTPQQVRRMRADYSKRKASINELASREGMPVSHVARVITGRLIATSVTPKRANQSAALQGVERQGSLIF